MPRGFLVRKMLQLASFMQTVNVCITRKISITAARMKLRILLARQQTWSTLPATWASFLTRGTNPIKPRGGVFACFKRQISASFAQWFRFGISLPCAINLPKKSSLASVPSMMDGKPLSAASQYFFIDVFGLVGEVSEDLERRGQMICWFALAWFD